MHLCSELFGNDENRIGGLDWLVAAVGSDDDDDGWCGNGSGGLSQRRRTIWRILVTGRLSSRCLKENADVDVYEKFSMVSTASTNHCA